jgi:hypothetical protein
MWYLNLSGSPSRRIWTWQCPLESAPLM